MSVFLCCGKGNCPATRSKRVRPPPDVGLTRYSEHSLSRFFRRPRPLEATDFPRLDPRCWCCCALVNVVGESFCDENLGGTKDTTGGCLRGFSTGAAVGCLTLSGCVDGVGTGCGGLAETDLEIPSLVGGVCARAPFFVGNGRNLGAPVAGGTFLW